MKKIISTGVFFFYCISWAISQTYTATISIESVNVSGLNSGDEIIVPLRLKEKSGGLIWGLQFFINYDTTFLKWKGTVNAPLLGIKEFNKQMPYDQMNWLFNDTGYQIACSWTDTVDGGRDIKKGEVFLEYIFIYKGGLRNGESISLTWGRDNFLPEGDVFKGFTEMYSEKMDYFELIFQDGEIKNGN